MRTIRFATLTLAAAALAACSEGITAPSEKATIRVLHAASTAGSANVRVDRNATSAALAFRDTLILRVDQGVRQLRVYAGADTTGATLINTNITVRAGESYTVVVSGNLPAAPAAPTLRSTIIQNLAFPLPAGTGQAGVGAGVIALPASAAGIRIVHASNNINAPSTTATVAAYLYAASAARPATASVASVTFPTVSDYFYVDNASGAFRLDITTTGAAPVQRATVTLPTLTAGALRTLIVLDAPVGGTPSILVVNDN